MQLFQKKINLINLYKEYFFFLNLNSFSFLSFTYTLDLKSKSIFKNYLLSFVTFLTKHTYNLRIVCKNLSIRKKIHLTPINGKIFVRDFIRKTQATLFNNKTLAFIINKITCKLIIFFKYCILTRKKDYLAYLLFKNTTYFVSPHNTLKYD
ncbi:hypothetical protein BWK58_07115 [Flavobacterium columnare]|nr:hypothetical protein BWK58_07115 [Flavobacterium columnare]